MAEAIGNWGFSNKVSSPGRELQRLKYLSEKMACMYELKIIRLFFNINNKIKIVHYRQSVSQPMVQTDR